ncbi:hypothetical protein ACNI5A_31125, partial [Klebsiella pneumoniae]|uniref:hypothetical protein n=1 Tax=Klebsiella pneumoniae TaxID=573 RepID=UPI003A88A9BF
FRIAAPSITRGLAVPLVGQLARDVKDGVMDTKTAQLRAVAQVARLRGGRKEPAPRPSVAGGHAPRAEGWTSRREPADEAFVQDLVE